MKYKSELIKREIEAAEYLKSRLPFIPETAVILGSGLDFIANSANDKTVIRYDDIPNFPVSTAPFHKSELVCCRIYSENVLLFCGRSHYYEGYSMSEITFPIRVMKLLGIKRLVQTNAVGAINSELSVGDIMLIEDHIKFFNDTPLRGPNIAEFGTRFFDMSNAYSKRLALLAKSVAAQNKIPLFSGVYAYMPGPCYETSAEIRMLRTLGADVVGMSTVPETIAAVHASIEVLAISFCTNMAAGISHKIEELEFTDTAKKNLDKLISGILCHSDWEEKCITETK